jgi:hypothetical protein
MTDNKKCLRKKYEKCKKTTPLYLKPEHHQCNLKDIYRFHCQSHGLMVLPLYTHHVTLTSQVYIFFSFFFSYIIYKIVIYLLRREHTNGLEHWVVTLIHSKQWDYNVCLWSVVQHNTLILNYTTPPTITMYSFSSIFTDQRH